jgi:hypothetical protein
MQSEALPADPRAHGELCDKLAALSLPLPQGQPSSPSAEQWSGETYKLDENELKIESIAIEFGNDRGTLIVRNERGEQSMSVGFATWLTGTIDVRGRGDEAVTACGAWTAEDAYEVRVCFYESEFCPVLRFHYSSAELRLEIEPNVAWGQTTVTTITGRVAVEAA